MPISCTQENIQRAIVRKTLADYGLFINFVVGDPLDDILPSKLQHSISAMTPICITWNKKRQNNKQSVRPLQKHNNQSEQRYSPLYGMMP